MYITQCSSRRRRKRSNNNLCFIHKINSHANIDRKRETYTRRQKEKDEELCEFKEKIP